MKPCPNCGDTECGFSVNGQMHGPGEAMFDNDGKYIEMLTDHIYWTPNNKRIVRCAKCNKIRNDLIFEYVDDCRRIVETT